METETGERWRGLPLARDLAHRDVTAQRPMALQQSRLLAKTQSAPDGIASSSAPGTHTDTLNPLDLINLNLIQSHPMADDHILDKNMWLTACK